MVNKKGYIKTLEAVIAIIMIVIVSYTLIPRPAEAPPDVPLIVKGSQKIIDQTIQLNETMRNLITKKQRFNELSVQEREDMLTGVKAIIDYYVLERNVMPGYDYTCAICSRPGECLTCTPSEKSIYMTDVIIGSSETQQNPKVIRIWFWRKPTDPTTCSSWACSGDGGCLNKCKII